MRYKVAFRKDSRVTQHGVVQKGDYHLSSKNFDSYAAAADYADTIDGSREPVILLAQPYTHLGVLRNASTQ